MYSQVLLEQVKTRDINCTARRGKRRHVLPVVGRFLRWFCNSSSNIIKNKINTSKLEKHENNNNKIEKSSNQRYLLNLFGCIHWLRASFSSAIKHSVLVVIVQYSRIKKGRCLSITALRSGVHTVSNKQIIKLNSKQYSKILDHAFFPLLFYDWFPSGMCCDVRWKQMFVGWVRSKSIIQGKLN